MTWQTTREGKKPTEKVVAFHIILLHSRTDSTFIHTLLYTRKSNDCKKSSSQKTTTKSCCSDETKQLKSFLSSQEKDCFFLLLFFMGNILYLKTAEFVLVDDIQEMNKKPNKKKLLWIKPTLFRQKDWYRGIYTSMQKYPELSVAPGKAF